jgi:hypothetical protein
MIGAPEVMVPPIDGTGLVGSNAKLSGALRALPAGRLVAS